MSATKSYIVFRCASIHAIPVVDVEKEALHDSCPFLSLTKAAIPIRKRLESGFGRRGRWHKKPQLGKNVEA